MRKPTKSSMTRKLDIICSQIIRKSQCVRCGEPQYDKLQCAHIFSRTYRSTRWLLLNLMCLCASCHFWAHRNPLLFSEFVKEYLGDHNYNQLKMIATSIKKFTLDEMVGIYEDLKRIYDSYDDLKQIYEVNNEKKEK